MTGGAVRARVAAGGFPAFLAASRAQPIYVILGVQGSGTNLLVRLLTRVFGASIFQDQSLVVRVAGALPPQASREQVDRRFREIESHLFPSRWQRRWRRRLLHRDEQFEGIREQYAAADLRCGSDLARFVYAYRAFVRGGRLIGIKSDDIWAHLDVLDDVLPHRRIILLTRDFRDNAVSVAGKPFGPVEPLAAARFVRERFARYEAEYRRDPALSWHVRFEDLVAAPIPTLEAMALRFGLSFATDPATALATLTIRPGRVGRWRELSERNRAWCESALADPLVRFGYVDGLPPDAVPTSAEECLMRARDAARRVPAKLRHLGGRWTT